MNEQVPYISAGPYQDIISGTQLILSFSDGVVKLTGPVGAGKTSLLHQLKAMLAAEKQEAILFSPPPKSMPEMHNKLTREFSLGADLGFRKSLARHIASKPRDQQSLILIIDDVENLDDESLLDLIQFRNIMHNGQRLVSLILCGLPELNERLAASQYAELTRDIVLDYALEPLSREELGVFCEAAIETLALAIPMPSPRALDLLLAESGGLPGLVLEKLPQITGEPEPETIVVTLPAAAVPARPAAVPVPAQPAAVPAQPAVVPARPAAITGIQADSDDFDDEDDAYPLGSSKLRKGLYGGAAIAASVAAVYLLYPVVAPLIQKPASTVVSIPKPVVETPAPAMAEIVTEPAGQQAETVPEATTELATNAVEPEAPQTDSAEPEAVLAAATIQAATETTAPVAAPEPASAGQAAVATLVPPAAVSPVPAPAASSTVSLVPVFPAASLQDDSPQALENLVQNWLSAWQNKDLNQYFGAYHTDFAPLYQSTRAAWRNNRLRSMSRPAAISIAMEDFTVNGSSAIGTHVSFWMEYHTSSYADRTLKELVIGHDVDGSLRILQEINRQVTTLTPSDLVPGLNTSVIATNSTPAINPGPAVQVASGSGNSGSGSTATSIGSPVQLNASITNSAVPLAADASITAAQTAEINNFLSSWLDAWQHQDVVAYFNHYHPQFSSSAYATHAAWQEDRIRKINTPLAIQIHLQNLQVKAVSGSDSALELQMEYHSTYYADRTVKEMKLERSAAGAWQITMEKNLRVEPLPLARLVPGNTITLRGGINTIFEHAL